MKLKLATQARIYALEQRIMFDGAMAITAVDAIGLEYGSDRVEFPSAIQHSDSTPTLAELLTIDPNESATDADSLSTPVNANEPVSGQSINADYSSSLMGWLSLHDDGSYAYIPSSDTTHNLPISQQLEHPPSGISPALFDSTESSQIENLTSVQAPDSSLAIGIYALSSGDNLVVEADTGFTFLPASGLILNQVPESSVMTEIGTSSAGAEFTQDIKPLHLVTTEGNDTTIDPAGFHPPSAENFHDQLRRFDAVSAHANKLKSLIS